MPAFRASAWPGLAGAVLLAAVGAENSAKPATERLIAAGLEGPVTARVEHVVDGDTIDVRAAIWIGQSLFIRLRIDGVDAPELEGRCAEERRMANEAREYLVKRLAGKEVKLSRIVYDKYGGRVRAEVSDASGDIGEALLKQHLARPYHGERRQPWCAR